ncbi:Shikimate kinase [groundwater metagenome]|uniref:shikimate kinase n=1 Tax=groundwater metagenome TaxID=717931 RepID=A0A098EBL2_9ZZZZ
MNIVLIGFRGTGKSTVGKILSKETGWKFISSDDEIENKYGKISKLVSDNGWGYFRRLEEDVIGNIAKEDKTIIATGGGVVMNSNNVQNLKKNGKFILLTASKENIINRIKNSDRPRLTTGTCIEEEVDKILNERIPVYLSIADYIIETSSLTPKDIAEKIIKMVINK